MAEAAGWRDLRVLKRSYQQSDAATVLRVVENAPTGLTSDTPPSLSADRAIQQVPYRISGTNMMCALGVPGNMIHGVPDAGAAESPVLSAVANGM